MSAGPRNAAALPGVMMIERRSRRPNPYGPARGSAASLGRPAHLEEIVPVNLSAPKAATFWIAVLLWLLGLLGAFVPALQTLFSLAGQGSHFWLAVIGGLLLALGNALEGV